MVLYLRSPKVGGSFFTLILALGLYYTPGANLYYNVQDFIRQTVNPWKSSSSHLREKTLILRYRKGEFK